MLLVLIRIRVLSIPLNKCTGVKENFNLKFKNFEIN
jgi:hypothetical protein